MSLGSRVKGWIDRVRAAVPGSRPARAPGRGPRLFGAVPAPWLEHRSLSDAWNSLRADYDAAKTSRFRETVTGVSPSGSGADFHYRSEADYLRLLELARAMDRNDMLIGQGVSRLINNVLQQGMRLNPDTGDRKLDDDLSARWREWSRDANACHNTGQLTLHEQARLVMRSTLVDGDHFVLPMADGTLQLVESHRCRSPHAGASKNTVLGVRLRDDRRPVGYFFTKDDINPNRTVSLADLHQFPALDPAGNPLVFHILNRKRPTQTRGISVIATIADAVGMLGQIQFAHLVQAQICSAFAIIHEFDEVEQRIGKRKAKGSVTEETQADGSIRILEQVSPGMQMFGRPGEKITGFSPSVPNSEFFQHATLIMTLIAINLDLPVQALLMDATKTNFSGWRGAFDQAKYGFRNIQDWMICRFYDPVYAFKLTQWTQSDPSLARALDRGNVNLSAHDWNKPSWPYIEPNKDIDADTKRLNAGMTSLRRLHAERSQDWDELRDEIVADRVALINAAMSGAKQLNTTAAGLGLPSDVHWRDLAPGITSGAGVRSARPPSLPAPVSTPADRNRNGNGRITNAA